MATLTPLASNVLDVWASANAEQITRGLDWYADAHRIAAELADAHGSTVEIAAGILAALSPMNSWGHNVRLGTRFFEAGGLKTGYLSVGLAKAQAILDGADVLSTLKSDKIVNFARCIMAAGETDAVCVDRHAMDIALDLRQTDATRGKLTPKQYGVFADVYREAAAEIGEYAARVQAVTWTAWRQRYWAVGAFDGGLG